MNAHPRHDFTPDERAMHFGEQRELPVNIDAEQGLLGAILVNNDAYGMVSADLEARHFGEPLHAAIYEACGDLISKGKTAHTVSIMPYLPRNETVGGMSMAQYLAHLAVNAVTVINAPDFAAAIKFYAMKRFGISIGTQMMDAAFAAADELSFLDQTDALRSAFDDIRTGLQGEDAQGTSLAAALDQALRRTEKAHQGADDTGIDCGVLPVTRLIGRLTPGQLIIVGGGTKQGKSALAGQMARGAALNGWPVFTYSGEMGADELAMREISRDTGVSVSRQKAGEVSDREYQSMAQARSSLASLRWHIEDRRRTLDQLEREFEAYAKRNGPALFVVDSVTLIDRDNHTRRMSGWEFAEVVTDRLKGIARRLKSPIIALSQLKKNTFAVEKPFNRKPDASIFKNIVNRRPRYSDILGACERDADHVLIPFRAEPILEEVEPADGSDDHLLWEEVMEANRGRAEIILALSREQRWPRKQSVLWDGTTTTFSPPGDTGQARMF